MKFVNRLTREQVETFFREYGIMCPVSWEPSSFCAYVGSTPGNCSIVKLSDEYIDVDRFFEISDADWQVYLRKIFGAEYMKFLNKFDYSYDFARNLSHEDVLKLLKFVHIYGFKECEALSKGTRRFKVKYEYDGPYQDIIIGPDYDNGNLSLYGITKDEFDDFMANKYGKAYVDHWLKKERQNLISKLKSSCEYQKSEIELFSEKIWKMLASF